MEMGFSLAGLPKVLAALCHSSDLERRDTEEDQPCTGQGSGLTYSSDLLVGFQPFKLVGFLSQFLNEV